MLPLRRVQRKAEISVADAWRAGEGGRVAGPAQHAIPGVEHRIEAERLGHDRRVGAPPAPGRHGDAIVELLLERLTLVHQRAVRPRVVQRGVVGDRFDEAAGPEIVRVPLIQQSLRDSAATDEATLGAEALVDGVERIAELERLAVPAEYRVPERRVRARRGRRESREAVRVLRLCAVDPREYASSVHRRHAIVPRALRAVRERHAELRPRADVALQPRDGEHRMSVAVGRAGGAVDGVQHADVEPRQLARDLRGSHGLHDAACVDEVLRRIEELRAVEEEWALLGEEQRLARVEDDLAGVGFNLGEVGIDRTVQREVVADSPPEIAADTRMLGVVAPRRSCGSRPARRALSDLGGDVEDQSAPQLGETLKRPRLTQERGVVAPSRRPAVFAPRVLDRPHRIEAPRLRIGALILEALERHAHLDFVAVLGEPSLRLEDEVGVEIGKLAAVRAPRPTARLVVLDQRAIRLHAERIDAEHDRLTAVVERPDEQLDAVVAEDLVTIAKRGMHGAVRLIGPDAEVDGGRRVPDEHFGGVFGGDTVARRELRESGEHRRHCGSSSVPSMRSAASSSRGGLTSSWFWRPLRTCPAAGGSSGATARVSAVAAANRRASGAIEPSGL